MPRPEWLERDVVIDAIEYMEAAGGPRYIHHPGLCSIFERLLGDEFDPRSQDVYTTFPRFLRECFRATYFERPGDYFWAPYLYDERIVFLNFLLIWIDEGDL